MTQLAQGSYFPIDAESKECVLFLWRVRFVWPCAPARPPARWAKQAHSHANFKISARYVQANISTSSRAQSEESGGETFKITLSGSFDLASLRSGYRVLSTAHKTSTGHFG